MRPLWLLCALSLLLDTASGSQRRQDPLVDPLVDKVNLEDLSAIVSFLQNEVSSPKLDPARFKELLQNAVNTITQLKPLYNKFKRSMSAEQIHAANSETCAQMVINGIIDPTHFPHLSPGCIELALPKVDQCWIVKNASFLGPNWFTEDTGSMILVALGTHDLSILQEASFLAIVWNPRLCSHVTAAALQRVPPAWGRYLQRECVGNIQGLDSISLPLPLVAQMSDDAFASPIINGLHLDTLGAMSVVQVLHHISNEHNFNKANGFINWTTIFALPESIKLLPIIEMPFYLPMSAPEPFLDKQTFLALAERSPGIAGSLLVKVNWVPDDVLALCSPTVLRRLCAFVCDKPVTSTIRILETLLSRENGEKIISNISRDVHTDGFCESLTRDEYLQSDELRKIFYKSCYGRLNFEHDFDTPELRDANSAHLIDEVVDERWKRFTSEDYLRGLQPTVEWKDCRMEQLIEGTTCRAGIMSVPSNYWNPDKETIDIEVTKYQRHPDIRPTSHVILMSGGPGIEVSSLHLLTWDLLRYMEDTAFYHYEHRGVSRNSPGQMHAEKGLLDDERDYLVENAALDVGMLAIAIKEESQDPECSVSLFGGSYGGTLGNHVVQLLPGLFDAAILSGTPAIPSVTGTHTIDGLLLDCQLDDSCRGMIGSPGHFYQILRTIATYPNANQCCALMHERLCLAGLPVEQVMHKIGNMFTMLDLDVVNGRMLLPMVKATYDCADFEAYQSVLITMLQRPLPLLPVPPSAPPPPIQLPLSRINLKVLALVAWDHRVEDHRVSASSLSFNDFYFSRYRLKDEMAIKPYRACIGGRRVSRIKPAKTTRTRMVIINSLMDTITTFTPAQRLFDLIEAPIKAHLRLRTSHSQYPNECKAQLIRAALKNELDTFNSKECLELSEERRPKWDLSDLGALKNVWKAVKMMNNVPAPPDLPPEYHVVKQRSICATVKFPLKRNFPSKILGGKCESPTRNGFSGEFVRASNFTFQSE